MRFLGRDRGFTLVEMLFIVAIIALLSSVVIFSVQGAKEKARNTQRYSDYENIAIALRLYKDFHGEYPNTLDASNNPRWQTACADSAGVGDKDLTGSNGYVPDIAPDFMPILPTEPSGCAGGAAAAVKGYIYRSDGTDYKFASDWITDEPSECEPGGRFADGHPERSSPNSDGDYFCSISTPGADGW